MKKFIITEEEKKQILNLYEIYDETEQSQVVSNGTLAKILKIDVSDLDYLDIDPMDPRRVPVTPDKMPQFLDGKFRTLLQKLSDNAKNDPNYLRTVFTQINNLKYDPRDLPEFKKVFLDILKNMSQKYQAQGSQQTSPYSGGTPQNVEVQKNLSNSLQNTNVNLNLNSTGKQDMLDFMKKQATSNPKMLDDLHSALKNASQNNTQQDDVY